MIKNNVSINLAKIHINMEYGRTHNVIVNVEKVSNVTVITEEFNYFFAEIGKSINNYVPLPTASFHSYENDRFPVNSSMLPTNTAEMIKYRETNALLLLAVYVQHISNIYRINMHPLVHVLNQSFVTCVIPEHF